MSTRRVAGPRSTSYSSQVHGGSFCLLITAAGRGGHPITLLRLRAQPDERAAMLALGHPYFASRHSPERLGVLLTDHTDWPQIGELITDELPEDRAPTKLTALLDR